MQMLIANQCMDKSGAFRSYLSEKGLFNDLTFDMATFKCLNAATSESDKAPLDSTDLRDPVEISLFQRIEDEGESEVGSTPPTITSNFASSSVNDEAELATQPDDEAKPGDVFLAKTARKSRSHMLFPRFLYSMVSYRREGISSFSRQTVYLRQD